MIEADFSSFRINSKRDKYLFNAFNLSLLAWQDKIPGPKVKNENKENIENLFDLIQKLNLYPFTSKRDL